MNTLFDIAPAMPEGFSYYPNFITRKEEESLIQTISSFKMETMKFHQYEAKRKVVSFGHSWSFTEQQLKKTNDIPAAFDFLTDKIFSHLSIEKKSIAQLLITEYPIGSVINWHRDAPPFDIIVGVSLLSDCIFKLRPHDKERQN